MPFEKECDIILPLIDSLTYTRLESNGSSVSSGYLLQEAFNIGIDPKTVQTVIAILISNDHVVMKEVTDKIFFITQKGRAFAATTSYVQENRLLELQRQLNQKTLQKLEQGILLNGWLLKTKWWPLIFTIVGLIISILAYNESRKEHNQKPNYETNSNTVKGKQ